MATWSLYLLRTRRGALYTGIATDVERRLREHAAGSARGARSLRAQGPLALVYRVELGSQGLALQAERRVKRLSKPGKEQLVSECPAAVVLLERLGLAMSEVT